MLLQGRRTPEEENPRGGAEHLRGFPADLAMVPLFAVGEVLPVGAFELLHGANVGPEHIRGVDRDLLLPTEPGRRHKYLLTRAGSCSCFYFVGTRPVYAITSTHYKLEG